MLSSPVSARYYRVTSPFSNSFKAFILLPSQNKKKEIDIDSTRGVIDNGGNCFSNCWKGNTEYTIA